ncbi:MAG: hypothetical protein ABI569_08060 [Casimicrobiaceae bacterium]
MATNRFEEMAMRERSFTWLKRPFVWVPALTALLVTSAPALGAAQRTFVASYGLTANTAFNCSLAKPCRAFNEAIGVTSLGGEVVILDTAGYGPMTINQSIKIIGPSGVYGGISVTGGANPTTGIVINAGFSDVITLRGLDISGVPGVAGPFPLVGIDIQKAGAVHIEKTSVSNFTQDASECIRMSVTAPVSLFVVDSFLRECATGVHIDGTTVGEARATIDNTHIEQGTNTQSGTAIVGVKATGNYMVNIRKSLISSGIVGVLASQTVDTDKPSVTIVDSQITLMANGAIKMGPGPGPAAAGLLRVNLQRSTINESTAAVMNGYGTIRLTDNVFSNVSHLFVNCGSDQFWGPSFATNNTGVLLGSNFGIDFLNGGAGLLGCSGYNSPGKIAPF